MSGVSDWNSHWVGILLTVRRRPFVGRAADLGRRAAKPDHCSQGWKRVAGPACAMNAEIDASGAAVGLVAPVVLPENAKRLSDGVEQALRRNLDRMLDALPVPARDPACSDRHSRKIAVSCFVRYGEVEERRAATRREMFRRWGSGVIDGISG